MSLRRLPPVSCGSTSSVLRLFLMFLWSLVKHYTAHATLWSVLVRKMTLAQPRLLHVDSLQTTCRHQNPDCARLAHSTAHSARLLVLQRTHSRRSHYYCSQSAQCHCIPYLLRCLLFASCRVPSHVRPRNYSLSLHLSQRHSTQCHSASL